MKAKLNYVIKFVGDMEKAVHYHHDVLGLPLKFQSPEWSEFANVDLAVLKEKMTTPIVFDGRNLFDPKTMAQLGFRYHSIGRASLSPK